MDLLNLLTGDNTGNGSPMDLLRNAVLHGGDAPAPPQNDPNLNLPGASSGNADSNYALNYSNALNAATLAGRSTSQAPGIARAAANDQYSKDLQDSSKVLDIARQSREAAAARARYPQMLDQSAADLGLTQAEYQTLKVLPPDQGIQALTQRFEAKRAQNAQRYSIVTAGDGTVFILDKLNGTTEMQTSGGGAPTKSVDIRPNKDGTFSVFDKTSGAFIRHMDANGQATASNGKAGGGGITGTALEDQLKAMDTNGLYTGPHGEDSLAPPTQEQVDALPRAPTPREITTKQNSFLHDPVIRDLITRSNEHANIVANVNSPDVTPQDRANKDISLLYMFAHMLNPTVSVKEGETDQLKQALPVLDRLGISAQKVINGQSLLPQQRQSLLRESGVYAHGSIGLARNTIAQWGAQLRAQGIHPGVVITDPTRGIDFGDESGTLRGGANAAGGNSQAPSNTTASQFGIQKVNQ